MNQPPHITNQAIPVAKPDVEMSTYAAGKEIPVSNNGSIKDSHPKASKAATQGAQIRNSDPNAYGQNVIVAEQGPDYIYDWEQLAKPIPYTCQYCNHSGVTRMKVIITREKKCIIICLFVFLSCCLIPCMKHLNRYEHYCTNCHKCIKYYQITGPDE
ncbi:unnamed protein product [Moneuplotes crassus]|uniref:LITAF domain-containing protein n=1 Tax=Euplotes crassus TaxID=5936 RepID=A0AAD1XYC8_EUPCR|nr:unnamed protein product [Moneuplotes crassus]